MKWSSHSLIFGSLFGSVIGPTLGRWLCAGFMCAGGLLLTAGSGCTPSNSVTPGAPVLLAFSVVTPAGTAAELVSDGGAPVPASPASYFYTLFDRILDPGLLEDINADSGVITPNLGVATVEWSGGSIPVTTLYWPNGHHKWTLVPAAFGLPFNVGPSVVINPVIGLPSATRVTVTLNPEKVRSHDRKNAFVAAADVPSPLVFETEALQVTFDTPAPVPADAAVDGGDADGGAPQLVTPDVATGFVLHATFNNVMTDAIPDVTQVVVTVAGVPVVGFVPVVARDASKSYVWSISPPASGWPARAVVTVTVGAGAADHFGGTLGTSATATFTVAP